MLVYFARLIFAIATAVTTVSAAPEVFWTSGENVTMATSALQEIRVGVLLVEGSGAPYDVHRSGAAVELALAEVNRDLAEIGVTLVPILKTFGPSCDPAMATGRKMKFRIK